MNNVEQTYKAIQADKKIPADIRKAGQFEALILVAKSRNVKHAVAILNCLNRLVVTEGIEQAHVKDLIDALQALASTNQDIQVKVLQTVPLLFSTQTVQLNGSNLAACLKIPIDLLEVNGIVGSIASATLQQVLVSIFDDPPQSKEADVSRIFEDLCATLASGQTGFASFGKVKKTVVLELLESIFAANNELFRLHPSLLDANLLPSIISLLTQESTSNELVVRSLRISALLLPQRESLLHALLEYLPKASALRQVLILETIEQSVKNIEHVQYPRLVSTLLLFEDSLPGLGTYSICVAPRIVDEQITADGLIFSDSNRSLQEQQGIGEWCRPSKPLTSQLQYPDLLKFHPEYKSLLILNVLSQVSCSPKEIWRDTLTLHSAALSSCISKPLETQLLADVSSVILKLDLLEDTRARELYLRRLGRIAVSSSLQSTESAALLGPNNSNRDMAHRSFATLETYLKVMNELRNSFSVRAWLQVLDILEHADSLLSLQNRRSSRNNGSLIGNVLSSEEKVATSDQLNAVEMSRLSSSIEDFFKASDTMENESFASLIEAICSMQHGIPGSPTTSISGSQINSPVPVLRRLHSGASSISSFGTHMPVATTTPFALEKLKLIAPPNVFRFVQIDLRCGWDILIGYLEDEIRADSTVAGEILGTIIVQASHLGLKSVEQQQRFIYALESFHIDGPAILIQLETLSGMLEILGHELVCGWELILKILYTSIAENQNVTAEAVRLGFSCLELICTDLLNSIPSTNMALLIETVVGYASQEEALNISLSAVGHFWTILRALPKRADFSEVYSQFPMDDDERTINNDDLLWLLLMENLLHISHDTRPEVRNMAIQASFRTIDVAESLGPRIWLSTIYLLLSELHTIPLTLIYDADGYIETVNAITGGTGKLALSSSEVLERIDEATLVWSLVTGYFLNIATCTRSETAAFALNCAEEIATAPSQWSPGISLELQEITWRDTVLTGQGLFAKVDGSMTQEGLATYFATILKLLENKATMKLNQDTVETILRLCNDGLLYTRSKTYYLDIDYLSVVQKPILAILDQLYGSQPSYNQLITHKVAQFMQLCVESLHRQHEYVFVQQRSATWSGRPTFIAFTIAIQNLLSTKYELAGDSNFSSLTQIIESSNSLLQIRFARPSISNKPTMYRLWITSTNQVINLAQAIEKELASTKHPHVWDNLVETGSHLLTSHQDQSEEYVLSALNRFRDLIIPSLGRQESSVIERYVEAIYRGSWFYEQAEVTELSTVASTYYTDQIIREWCFLELFKMSITSSSTLENGKSIGDDSNQYERCAQVALPYAIKRAKSILSRYINNAPLRGRAPLPRIEYAELLLLLDHLGDETITHVNQRQILKHVYVLVVEALLVDQGDSKVLGLLKDTLLRIAPFL